MSQVIAYTDGGASGNPGPGGYGVVLMWKEHKRELSEAFRLTTNNRMELLAVIKVLESLTRAPMEVVIYSDSKYVVDAVSKGWVFNWEKKGYKDKKNPDLWQRFLRAYRQHRVRFVWVRGHNGDPLNERADELAVGAYKKGPLLIDEGYERQEASLL
ncbi:MAG: ribonuclease HI [Flavobacteriales bacterium]